MRPVNQPQKLHIVFASAALAMLITSLSRADETPAVVNLGAGYVSTDSIRAGRYTGLKEDGPIGVADIEAEYRDKDARYFSFIGTDLGLESRTIDSEFGKQGEYEFNIEYYELPNFKAQGAETPFEGSGTSFLSLPPGWVRGPTTSSLPLAENLKPKTLETKRQGYGGGLAWIPKKHWNFSVDYRRETKDGIDRIGGAIAQLPESNPPPGVTFFTRGALFAKPIDYTTDKLDAVASYAKGKAQLEMRYQLSLFNNDIDALGWENPYSNDVLLSQPASAQGNLSLAPDNQFHRVSLTGGYQLPMQTRVTGVLAVGFMSQDEAFQPFTVNPAVARPLPRNSLDGKVQINTARLKLASRPMPRLRLNAGYRFYERDDNTSRATYNYVIADSHGVTDDPRPPDDPRAPIPVENEPFSYRQHQLELDARYRVSRRIGFLLGYGYEYIGRSPSEVNHTEEHSFETKLKIRPHSTLDTSFNFLRAIRNGSNYEPRRGENPLLRKYNLADRDRDKLGARINYMPHATVTFGASAEYVRNDYSNTRIGLTEAKQITYTLDASFAPWERFSGYVFFTHDDFDTTQVGSDVSGGPTLDTSQNWFADIDDTIDSVGVGFNFEAIPGKLDIGADYIFSDTRGKTDAQSLSTTGLSQLPQFPDLTTQLHSISINARYHFTEDAELRLRYVHEDQNSRDWALDNVEPDSVERFLLLGEDSPNYTLDVIALSLAYRF